MLERIKSLEDIEVTRELIEMLEDDNVKEFYIFRLDQIEKRLHLDNNK